jgi:hypothetical protein
MVTIFINCPQHGIIDAHLQVHQLVDGRRQRAQVIVLQAQLHQLDALGDKSKRQLLKPVVRHLQVFLHGQNHAKQERRKKKEREKKERKTQKEKRK